MRIFNHQEITRQYNELHKFCPMCRSDHHEVTCMGFIFANLETAEDRNLVTCLKCSWKGIVHDLIK